MISQADADGFADKVGGAISRIGRDYATGDSVHEDPTTGQLTGRVKESLEGFETENIRWQIDAASEAKGRARLLARPLTSKGEGSEETRLGADIVFCLDIELPDYVVKKGFLVQSKRLARGKQMGNAMASELREQCNKMLAVTAASMVFLYNEQGIHVCPAAAVAASRSNDIYSLPTYDIDILFRDFAMCWFGDTVLQATDPGSLQSLMRLTETREALLFKGTPALR